MSAKVWFMTGTSRLFGRISPQAAFTRGDKVAATARVLADVADLSRIYRMPPRANRNSTPSHPDL